MKRFSKGTVLLGIITALLPFFFVGQAHAEETDPIYEKVKDAASYSIQKTTCICRTVK